MRHRVRLAAFAVLFLLVIMQLVPFGRDHTNPEILAEPEWDSPATRALFYRTCKDCHSNETAWPWYASVAPASWLVYRDVEEGRSKFNVSEWGRPRQEADEAAEKLREGEMPPWFYLPLHAEARLDQADKTALLRGLIATFGEKHLEHD